MTTVAKIIVYPIKSLDGVELAAANVLDSGMLQNDRRYAMVDDAGKVFNAKRSPLVHRIQTRFDVDLKRVEMSWDGSPSARFHLGQQRGSLEDWLSDHLQTPLRLVVNTEQGFPDDEDALGPTIVSSASLREAASWFSDLDGDELLRRMRCNIVVDVDTPFWEDQFATTGSGPIQVGSVQWQATGICQRCVVPSRASDTGDVTPQFQKEFAAQRQTRLPSSSPREAFDHFYRFTVNTKLADLGTGEIYLGDTVTTQ